MKKIIANAGETKKMIDRHQFHLKKKLGQNFIIEPQVISSIVDAANINENDVVVEIGPGMGSLTQGLAERAGQVLAVELDRTLIPILQEAFEDYPNLTIVQGDALKVDYKQLLAPLFARGSYTPGFVVVANLPYYITTPIIMNLLESNYPWRRLVLMVQKEVADRMQATPGTKDYGALSVGVQYRAAAKVALRIPPAVFLPRPAVDSAVIVLERLAQPAVQVADEDFFFRVVAAAFGQRRKTLSNALSGGLALTKAQVLKALSAAEIDGGRRGETLSIKEFAVLTKALAEFLAATE